MIQPLTLELINTLKGLDRTYALRTYHKWLRSVRSEDKHLIKKEAQRVDGFKRRFKNEKKEVSSTIYREIMDLKK